MDKCKNKRSALDSCKNTMSGYYIEFGNTTFRNTLDERIQAAREASSVAKQAQEQNNKDKLCLPNRKNTTVENNTYFQNTAIKKTTNITHELKKKNRQCWPSSLKTDLEPTSISSSFNSTKIKNFHSNLHAQCYTSSSKPTYKGGGLMQRRLEAIKSAKKLSNTTSLPYDNSLESTKYLDNPSTNFSFQSTPTKNYNPNQLNINVPKQKAYKTISTIQKNPCKEVEHNTIIGLYNHAKHITNTSNNLATSVQNRLIKAKEEMQMKWKNPNQNNVSTIGIIEKPQLPHAFGNIHQDTNVLAHNLKHKTKRLNQSNHSIKKTLPNIVTTAKKVISNSSDVNKVINKQLITEQKKTIVPNSMISSNASVPETTVSTNLKKIDIIKEAKQKELDSFSFVIPQTSSVQQRLENIQKKQLNSDDSMEWEDIIEPNIIVEHVNDLRKTTQEYEPMEWTPDSIMHCDQINYCLVIDTNILLSDLKSITIVIDKYLPEYGYLTIVLPWQVLQELDCMKKNDNALGYRAREATRWLLEMFSKSHPRLKGQPMTQKNTNPDDSILKCAIIVKERVNFVILVTDDKILSIKSEVNGISVKNSSWLQNLVSNKNLKESQIFQEAVKKYPIIDNKLIMKFEPRLEHIIARVLKSAVSNMNYEIFSKKAWWKIYSLTPPLNLIKCLLKLKENWNKIAPQQLFKTPQKQLDWLVYFFKDLQQSAPEILNWNELYKLLKYCTEVLNALPCAYYHLTDMLLNDMMKARKFLKRKFDCTQLDEDLSTSLLNNLNISNNNGFNIDNILLNISIGVDTFCKFVYEVNGFKRDNLSEIELNCVLQKPIHLDETIEDYCCKLSNIIKVMLNVKSMKNEQILESCMITDEFLKAVVAFDNELVKLNKEALSDFCLMSNKNSFVRILLSFQNNLAAMKNLITTIKS